MLLKATLLKAQSMMPNSGKRDWLFNCQVLISLVFRSE